MDLRSRAGEWVGALGWPRRAPGETITLRIEPSFPVVRFLPLATHSAVRKFAKKGTSIREKPSRKRSILLQFYFVSILRLRNDLYEVGKGGELGCFDRRRLIVAY